MIDYREFVSSQRREMVKALAGLIAASAVLCGWVWLASNWVSGTPQVINVYVHFDQPSR